MIFILQASNRQMLPVMTPEEIRFYIIFAMIIPSYLLLMG